jgi:hypothetical protein
MKIETFENIRRKKEAELIEYFEKLSLKQLKQYFYPETEEYYLRGKTFKIMYKVYMKKRSE